MMKPYWSKTLVASSIWILAGLVGATGLSGCSETARPPQQAPAPVDPTRVFVENLLPSLNTELRQHAEAVATGKALATYLSREARRRWNARVDGGIKYADLFEEVYDKRDYHKVFAQSDGITPRGEAILEVLLDAERHALDTSTYHVGRVQTLVANLERITAGKPSWETMQLTPAEAEQLVGWLRDHQLDPHDPQTRREVLSALVGASVRGVADKGVLASPAPRITGELDRFLDTFEKTAELTAELELRVADGALRYARDMRHFNLARQDWRDLRDAGGSKALIYGRLEKTYDALSGASPEETGEILEDLEPQHPQYAKLLDALARYRAIAADGGWEKVRPTSLDLRARSPRVAALRARLAAEGFVSRTPQPAEAGGRGGDERIEAGAGSTDSAGSGAPAEGEPEEADPTVVDQQLIEAVKSYQETHQFRPDGDPTPGFWRSLNLSVHRRIDQIELSIQRWRESHYQGEEDFIMVNIPDFHAEVFRGAKRQMRFRVVTGNNKRSCDPETGEWKYPNATPVQMAKLDHVIVNPYWYVPKRIVREEIEPKMERDADYLEKKNYEIVELGGKETIRQKPGEGNALGRVKFIFPNPHNTYMHDTPHKKYFDYPVRAYSHGCVRVHEPLEFARHLLSHDEKGQKYEVDALVESQKQKYIELADKLPVFFEYFTVRVDDQGRPHFLADVYHHDQRRLAEEDGEEIDCRKRYRRRSAQPETHSDEEPEGVERDMGP